MTENLKGDGMRVHVNSDGKKLSLVIRRRHFRLLDTHEEITIANNGMIRTILYRAVNQTD